MSRRKIRNGGILVCDMTGCQVTFTTYSMLSLTRAQALNAGWARRNGRKVIGPDGRMLFEEGARKVDLCPKHGSAPEPPKLTKEQKATEKKQKADEEKAALAVVKKEKRKARRKREKEA